MRYLFLIYIILNPLFYWVGRELREAQEIFFRLSSIMLIFASLCFTRKIIDFKRQFSNMNIWIAVFCLYACANYFLWGCRFGDNVLFNIFFGVSVYMTALVTLDKEDTAFLFKGIAWVCLINMGYVAMQLSHYDPIFNIKNVPNGMDYMGLFGLKAAMGIYFALAMPIMASIAWWLPLGMFLMLGISVSTGAFLAGYAAYTFYLWHKSRTTAIVLGVIGLIGSVLFIVKIDSPMGMYSTRLPMWKAVLHDSLKNPFLGFGLDSFRKGNLLYYRDPNSNDTVRALSNDNQRYMIRNATADKYDFWDNAHNSYLMVLFEMGITGLVGVFLLAGSMIKRFKSIELNNEAIAVMGFFVALVICGLTQFPERLARIGHLIPVMLALFYINTKKEDFLDA